MAVVALMRPRDRRYGDALEASGVPVVNLGLASRWDLRAFRAATAAVRDQSPHIIHTHLKHADLLGAVASRRLGVPMLSTLHLIEDAPSPLGRAKRRLTATARTRTAARTIAVSDAQRTWYLNTFNALPGSVVTIPNGVVRPHPRPHAQRAALRAALGAGPRTALAVHVGLMRPGKGHVELIDALARVPRTIDLRVVMAGDGELRPQIEAHAARAGLAPMRLGFLGFRNDVSDLLDAADLVVSSSRFEALPTVLLQALGAGRPVVATDVGGVPEVVTEAEGILVPPADAAALAAAITRLATDSNLQAQLGAAGLRRFSARFEAETWARRLRELYDEVLSATPKG
jgi:glycosyltransferase involved in cell wall biosynthesis